MAFSVLISTLIDTLGGYMRLLVFLLLDLNCAVPINLLITIQNYNKFIPTELLKTKCKINMPACSVKIMIIDVKFKF